MDCDTGIDLNRVRDSGGTTCSLIGSSFTGKTTLLVSFVNRWVKEKAFDVIIIFTESPLAEAFQRLRPEVILSFGFHPAIVNTMVKINQATDNRYRFAIVIDDVSNIRDQRMVDKCITIYRNSGLSTLLSLQYAKMINPRQRSSLHRIIFTGSRSPEDRKLLIRMFLSGAIKEPNIALQDKWFMEHTELSGVSGKYFIYDSARDEVYVCTRPRLKDI